MTKISERYVMRIEDEATDWNEDVPTELNFRDAPDIRGLDVVERAKKTVEWWNSTRKSTEEPRKLVWVKKFTTETLYAS